MALDRLIFSQTHICMRIYPYLLSQIREFYNGHMTYLVLRTHTEEIHEIHLFLKVTFVAFHLNICSVILLFIYGSVLCVVASLSASSSPCQY